MFIFRVALVSAFTPQASIDKIIGVRHYRLQELCVAEMVSKFTHHTKKPLLSTEMHQGWISSNLLDQKQLTVLRWKRFRKLRVWKSLIFLQFKAIFNEMQ